MRVARKLLPALACLLAAAAATAAVRPAKERRAAPAFSVTDSSGRSLSLANYQGRVLALNFWATWCHGCKEELPWFVAFEKAYQDRGLSVVGLSTDTDGWKSVKPFLKTRPLNYAVAIADTDLAKLYALEAMPTTVLIDRDGRIAATYVGVVDRAAFERDLQALLKELGAQP